MALKTAQSYPSNSRTMAWRASLVLFLPLLACFVKADADSLSFKRLRVSSLLLPASCSPFKAGGGSSIEILNRHGPCSGTPPPTEEKKLAALAHDAARFSWMQETAAAGRAAAARNPPISISRAAIPLRNGLYIGTGEHVITVAYGTPARNQTVIFDTGNNMNWIQCKGCQRCYSQKEPRFDPARSSTYRNISCASPSCPKDGGCDGSRCAYWGSDFGSSTVGVLGTDTFTLSPGNVFPRFMFGCSQTFVGNFGRAAGMVGFGRSSYTLNSQVAKRLGNSFSYCFPSSGSFTGFLNFGRPLKKPLGYTPMVNETLTSNAYLIELIGISVGGKRLPLSPNLFLQTGTLIDSGTVNTYVPVAAYSELRAAFRASMVQYKMAPAAGQLDTCYDFSEAKTVKYPSIKLHFTGVDVEIPKSGVFNVINSSQACLAFLGSPGFGVVGSLNMKTIELTYDSARKRIGFSPRACG